MFRRSLARLVQAFLLLALTSPAAAATRSGQLETPLPTAAPAVPETRNGVITLAGGVYAYLPAGPAKPRPLLVVLHGAGGEPANVLESFRAHADANGIVLVIPRSIKGTWDMVEDLKSRLGAEMNVQPRYGKDLQALDTALADLFSKVAIDTRHVGIAGFSDGASYALSVGTANPQLFTYVMAFSPGHSFTKKYDKRQRVFISHGEKDEVLPFTNARGIAARLRGRGMTVEFEAFPGRHEVPAAIRDKAIAFFMSPAP
ncbi:phospholipase [Sphingomonas sp. HDW15A]|uniref:alpha/beta hydrolase n=1 Tax=Sphingomonas sp. HDW15A TaxID=2714942 RepID=UPI00140BB3DC|nr:dienelactone hydrolase family protein [Sphingomonas sp. HDW15A]QIK95536.1 phospholipase [Sphingomonas sp. HDW15A]